MRWDVGGEAKDVDIVFVGYSCFTCIRRKLMEGVGKGRFGVLFTLGSARRLRLEPVARTVR